MIVGHDYAIRSDDHTGPERVLPTLFRDRIAEEQLLHRRYAVGDHALGENVDHRGRGFSYKRGEAKIDFRLGLRQALGVSEEWHERHDKQGQNRKPGNHQELRNVFCHVECMDHEYGSIAA